MTEKIIVTKKVADAIRPYEDYGQYDRLLTEVAKVRDGWDSPWVTPEYLAKKYTLYQLSEILVKGYEVEKTPEEEVCFFYDQYQDACDFDDGVRLGVVSTLNCLGVKIKGINTTQ